MSVISRRRFRNIGIRTLFESVIYPEVLETLEIWKRNYADINKCVLIGGVATDFYVKSRNTEDVDLLFLTDSDIPNRVEGFKKVQPHMFLCLKTQVMVETVTSTHVKGNYNTFREVYDSAIESDGIKVASPLSIIALKLKRFGERDINDITNLIQYVSDNNIEFDFSKYDLSSEELNNFNKLYNNKSDRINENMLVLETNNYFRTGVKYKKFDIGDCELYMFKNEHIPIFHFGRNMQKWVNEGKEYLRPYKDFQFGFYIQNLKIYESSTYYNSMFNFEDEERMLKQWLKENKELVFDTWNELNPKIFMKNEKCKWNYEVNNPTFFNSIKEFKENLHK